MRLLYRYVTNLWILFAFILCLSAIFRLPLIQYTEFKGDEALTLFLASRPLFHHPFPPAALTSSAGILNFPLINYLLFPIIIFTLYPPTISFVIALINVITTGGFFLLFSKYHGKLTGFLASCIIGLSPWTILYSRKIWEQDFLLPLSLPFLLSIYKILHGKRNYWFLFGVSSILLLQIHQLAIFIPVVIFLALLFKKQKPLWMMLFFGILTGCIPTIPYFFYAYTTHFSNFHPTNSLVARFLFHDFTTFLRPLQILSIGNFHIEMGDDFALFASKFHSIYLFSKLSYLAYILVPCSFVVFWIKNKAYRFFIITVIAVVILYFILGIEPLMHYYILLVPFIAVNVAFLLTQLIRIKKIQYIGIAVTIMYLLSLTSFDYGFLQFLSEKHGFAGDYGAGYVESEKGAKNDLDRLKNQADFKELKLYYFLPQAYFHGYMPIGKMIFPYAYLKNREANDEENFYKQPHNPRLLLEVFAYYTQSQNPSWDYVTDLHNKAAIHPELGFTFQEVLREYLETNLKRVYETPDFWLLYPRHWSDAITSDGITLTDHMVAIDIQKQSYPFPSSRLLGNNYYSFSSRVVDKKLGKIDYANQVFKGILESIRTLPRQKDM